MHQQKEKAIGADVVGSLKPGQVLVKIVHDELVHLLGDEVSEVDFSKKTNSYYDGRVTRFWENNNFWENC